MQIFPTIDPDAERVLTFDGTKDLLANEVFQGLPIGPGLPNGPVVRVKLSAGIDTNPQNIIIGPPSYDNTGQFILQPVGNLSLLDGNDYEFEAVSACTAVDKIVVIRAILQVRSD